ncbi:MAG: TerC family protein [Verrucomicrobiota bacterium]|jgi:predicted tellurium resistance membrane protein TerC|nr:TerC family protein [Verrucomicrobiota bacterium]|tara:strand:- start:223 stop:1014 length:792 start_codon:yes stop_codon:yes gene_type:complete
MEIMFTLLMLILLQAVLGFDNLLYISLESKRAPEKDQSKVRKWGIAIAVGLRIVLLFFLVEMIGFFQKRWTTPEWAEKVIQGEFHLHSFIVLLGGVFIIYTAMKEIFHMIAVDDFAKDGVKREPTSSRAVVTKIVLMNLVFSFDSILSAIALTSVKGDISTASMWIMTIAIAIGGLLMILLADRVSEFLQRNRMYEVLGLFILFVVGILLLSEGGHLAHLQLFGHKIEAMSKATFYFVITVLVLVDVVQARYQKKLMKLKISD